MEARVFAKALAGPDGHVVFLGDSLSRAMARRPLSAAEIRDIRTAILGFDPESLSETNPLSAGIVGYVCGGVSVGAAGAGSLVAVEDHVNLTWRSPLAGSNDERIGPRFPSLSGVYAPEEVLDRVASVCERPAARAVVAGVGDARGLLPFESHVLREQNVGVVTSELVPVVLLAAHLGFRVAAGVFVVA